jgi:hypothetical protein
VVVGLDQISSSQQQVWAVWPVNNLAGWCPSLTRSHTRRAEIRFERDHCLVKRSILVAQKYNQLQIESKMAPFQVPLFERLLDPPCSNSLVLARSHVHCTAGICSSSSMMTGNTMCAMCSSLLLSYKKVQDYEEVQEDFALRRGAPRSYEKAQEDFMDRKKSPYGSGQHDGVSDLPSKG